MKKWMLADESAPWDKSMEFTYNFAGERKKVVYKENDTEQWRKYYFGGNYEKTIDGTNEKEAHFIAGGDGVVAVYVEDNEGPDIMYYIQKDYLGSWVMVTNDNNSTVEKYNYDPWGRLRNPADWSYTGAPAAPFLNRGFTGHEHIPEFNLINMNGRVYDPMVGMFLSPDPFVQAPGNAVNYNRYSYCINNPLIYTDPSGYYIYGEDYWENEFERDYYEHSFWTFDYTTEQWIAMTSPSSSAGYLYSLDAQANAGIAQAMATPSLPNGVKTKDIAFTSYYNNPQVLYLTNLYLSLGYTITEEGSGCISAMGYERRGLVVHSSTGDAGTIASWVTKVKGATNGGDALDGVKAAVYWGSTINTLYGLNEEKNLAQNLSRANAYKTVTGRVPKSLRTSIDYGEATTALTKGVSRSLFGVAIVLSAVDVYQDPSPNNIAWNTADLLMGAAAFVPGMQIPALIYFTARTAYEVYDAYNEP